MPTALRVQIQASLGEGHVNIIEAKEAILTDTHLCLVMEYAAGQVLTGDWQLLQFSRLTQTHSCNESNHMRRRPHAQNSKRHSFQGECIRFSANAARQAHL